MAARRYLRRRPAPDHRRLDHGDVRGRRWVTPFSAADPDAGRTKDDLYLASMAVAADNADIDPTTLSRIRLRAEWRCKIAILLDERFRAAEKPEEQSTTEQAS